MKNESCKINEEWKFHTKVCKVDINILYEQSHLYENFG